jgi:aminopeptidase-like protein
MYSWAQKLFPICRSLTGDGVRETLSFIGEHLPDLQIYEIPCGTRAFDWTIPPEWNVKDAYVSTLDGNRIIDFKKNNLHLVGYSEPIDEIITIEILNKHLYSLPSQPDAIPYVTSYYERNWGFCLTDNQRKTLPLGPFHIKIDSELNNNGKMTYGEFVLHGKSKEEILFSTYICHPSMANNELSGPVVILALAQWLASRPALKYTYRFLFIPETIGSIFYISQNLEKLKKNVVAGWQVTCVGDSRAYSFLPSRNGKTLADKISKRVLEKNSQNYLKYTFLDRGSDERQWCSPGVDLPIASIMRSKHGEYAEYHTSLDDLTVISPEGLEGSLRIFMECVNQLENINRPRVNQFCEPQLGKRGLYPNLSIKNGYSDISKLMNVLTYCDGTNDLDDLKEVAKISNQDLEKILDILYSANLIV